MYTLSQSHTWTWEQVSCDQYRFSTTKSSIVCYLYIRFVSSSAASHKTYLSMVQRGQQGMVAVQHSCQTRHVLHILLFLSHTVQYSCQTHTLHTSLPVTHSVYVRHILHILLFLSHTVQHSCQTHTSHTSLSVTYILHTLLFLSHTYFTHFSFRHTLCSIHVRPDTYFTYFSSCHTHTKQHEVDHSPKARHWP